MSNSVTGKLIETTPVVSREHNGNTYVSCLAIIETVEQYPKKVAVELPNENLIEAIEKVPAGSMVKIDVNIQSNKSKTNPHSWFTVIKAWRIERQA